MDEMVKSKREVAPITPELGNLDGVWDTILLGPVREFLNRPSKAIRGRLVEVGYRLATGIAGDLPLEARRLCGLASDAVESIHAGSLVIDDIQDGSTLRRGGPTLHRQMGLPLALNAGNWLYFWPLAEVESWGLAPEQEIEVYRFCHRSLLHAHYGQALDIGTPMSGIPQNEVEALCLTSLRLKTGALMALAVGLGAVVGRMPRERLNVLEARGTDFGVSLQMFDDLGNLLPKKVGVIPDPKQWEDLKLGRPSWVWAVVASESTPESYSAFKLSVSKLPDDEALRDWISRSSCYASGKSRAQEYMRTKIRAWREDSQEWNQGQGIEKAFELIHGIASELTRAYEQ